MCYKLDNDKHLREAELSSLINYITSHTEGKAFSTLQPYLRRSSVPFTFSKEVLQVLEQYYSNYLCEAKAQSEISMLI